MIKVYSSVPPAMFVAPVTGITYVIPTWQAVPAGTTMKDLEWVPPPRAATVPQTAKEYKVKTYTVRVYGGGQKVTCDCPGYTFRKKCKHQQEYAK